MEYYVFPSRGHKTVIISNLNKYLNYRYLISPSARNLVHHYTSVFNLKRRGYFLLLSISLPHFFKHLKYFNITINTYIKMWWNKFATLFVLFILKIIELINNINWTQNNWNHHTYKHILEISKHVSTGTSKDVWIIVNVILLFTESYFNRYYQRSSEKIKLAKVIIKKHIENHIHWEETILIIKSGKSYQPSIFSLNSIFKLKLVAAILPGNNSALLSDGNSWT